MKSIIIILLLSCSTFLASTANAQLKRIYSPEQLQMLKKQNPNLLSNFEKQSLPNPQKEKKHENCSENEEHAGGCCQQGEEKGSKGCHSEDSEGKKCTDYDMDKKEQKKGKHKKKDKHDDSEVMKRKSIEKPKTEETVLWMM